MLGVRSDLGRIFAAFLAILGLALAGVASAEDRINWDRIDLAAERKTIEDFQKYDQLLQDVGWKLARANAGFCDRVIPSIGLQMQDMASYGSPQVARRALGLKGDFAVQTAAKGSPSALSGAFRANREIAFISGLNPTAWTAEKRFDWQRLKRAHDYLDTSASQNPSVQITFANKETANVRPVSVCASRFELIGEGDAAVANGSRVAIGIEFPAWRYEEPEFAALIAHELAHNLLGHTNWLDRNGRSNRHTRLTEREADRLMPWLLVNAGYDPQASERFLKELRPASGGFLFFRGSHPKWRERVETVQAEIDRIREMQMGVGKADWRTHFRREIDPNRGL